MERKTPEVNQEKEKDLEEGNERRFEGENRAMMCDEEQREDANALFDLLHR